MDLRIFTYQPNPRLMKATIAARINGVDIDTRGAAPRELANWLWDFDAHPLADDDPDRNRFGIEARTGFSGRLYKTPAFLDANPFGTVPVAFSPDGRTGIFESNSILRAVARIGRDCGLYGEGPFEAARIDAFLDASLVFARDSQVYLLALARNEVTPAIHAQALSGVSTYLAGMNQALESGSPYLCGESVTLADICYACEIALFSRERLQGDKLEPIGLEPCMPAIENDFPAARDHFRQLIAHPAFEPDLGPYCAKLGP